MYGNFAGRDASRGMAKQSFDVGTSRCLLFERCRFLTSLRLDRDVNADRPTTWQAWGSLSWRDVSAVVLFPCSFKCWPSLLSSENMKGWIEHFSNKYIICGRLVENDAGESWEGFKVLKRSRQNRLKEIDLFVPLLDVFHPGGRSVSECISKLDVRNCHPPNGAACFCVQAIVDVWPVSCLGVMLFELRPNHA